MENVSQLRFHSMPNFRRVEGQSNDQSGGERSLKVFRSSRPDFLTDSEVAEFKELGIRSVIDFRSAKEYKKANGAKLLDRWFPVYKVKLPLLGRYKPNDRIRYVPVGKVQPPQSVSNGNNLKTETPKPEPEKDNVNGTNDMNGKASSNGHQGKHFLVNFFKMNYIWAVYNRAPWYIKLYSLLFLVVDIILNTGYRYFVRVFARNVLNKEGLVGQYIDMINYSQGPICSALKLLADPNNLPAMVNCAHGKDRTGLVSAMVLACFDESKEHIAWDYAQSESELAPMRDRVYDEIVNKFHMCESFTRAQVDTMMEVLTYVEKQYGSLSNYMEYIGFNREDQERLKENLVA